MVFVCADGAVHWVLILTPLLSDEVVAVKVWGELQDSGSGMVV